MKLVTVPQNDFAVLGGFSPHMRGGWVSRSSRPECVRVCAHACVCVHVCTRVRGVGSLQMFPSSKKKTTLVVVASVFIVQLHTLSHRHVTAVRPGPRHVCEQACSRCGSAGPACGWRGSAPKEEAPRLLGLSCGLGLGEQRGSVGPARPCSHSLFQALPAWCPAHCTA